MSALAGQVIGLYERHALAWDRDRNRGGQAWADRSWHDRLLSLLPPRKRVLDLGCGSGAPVAAHLAAHGARITGVDGSAAMIALCRQRLPGHEWRVGDMRRAALGQRFDGILAWDSFFHLTEEDQRGMFGVFARHAAPGALLMFNSGGARGEAIGAYRGEALYHASLDAGDYEALLREAGFAVLAHVRTDESCGGRTVWLARDDRRQTCRRSSIART